MKTLVLAGVAVLLFFDGHANGGQEMANGREIKLTADMLYEGFDARRVLPDRESGLIRLDKRVFKHAKRKEGLIVTDPIALIPSSGGIMPNAAVTGLKLAVDADMPEGASVDMEYRTGPGRFSDDGWSAWRKCSGLSYEAPDAALPFAQVRLTLSANIDDKLPGVSAVVLTPAVRNGPDWSKSPAVTEDGIRKIVFSPVEFLYERPDHPALAKFRKEAQLDKVVEGAADDYEALQRVQDWVARSRNERPKGMKYRNLNWGIASLLEMEPDKPETRVIKGHCLSYAEVMVDAATALGYKARHMAILGFREMSHEVVEAWVPSLGKWVFFDPSLANNYHDLESKTPLNLLEIHDLVAEKFLDEGRTMKWFCARSNPEVRKRVKEAGGKQHIGCRLGGWMYGQPMPADYDWGWKHGWLVAGFVQMTPRNDFHTNPAARSANLGQYPGYDDYPFWADAKTPPRGGARDWFTRKRDFYWTPDQASFDLVRTDREGTLRVRFGQSMPFFKSYRVAVDGTAVRPTSSDPGVFDWNLKPGMNRIEVVPYDEFGKAGAGSSSAVRY